MQSLERMDRADKALISSDEHLQPPGNESRRRRSVGEGGERAETPVQGRRIIARAQVPLAPIGLNRSASSGRVPHRASALPLLFSFSLLPLPSPRSAMSPSLATPIAHLAVASYFSLTCPASSGTTTGISSWPPAYLPTPSSSMVTMCRRPHTSSRPHSILLH